MPRMFRIVLTNQEPAVPRMLDEDMYDNMSVQYQETETPDDNMTVASLMDDDYNFSAPPSQRKRKRSPSGPLPLPADQQAHLLYADSLLDYFMLSTSEAASRPEPPPNFNPNWTIDTEGHTALHWAAAMGDLDVMRQLRAFGADIEARNLRDETPLMRAVLFTNCFDRLSMPRVVGDLISTVGCADKSGCTAIHHAANLTQSRTKHHCARYYLDVILNKMSETMEQEEIQRILNLQDNNGFTACHIAARNRARKCLRALMGRGAVTDIPDNSGIRVEQLIPELNATRRPTAPVQSSSPFAPDTVDRSNFYAEPTGAGGAGLSGRDGGEAGRPQMNLAQALSQARQQPHHSEAAQTVSSKITPLVISKFQDLARSFDEELREREADEKESRRILAQSAKELAEVQRATTELGVVEDDSAGARNEQNQLQHAKTRVISLVEQGQSILISASVADKGNQMNGLPNGDSESGQDPEELIKLLEELREEQTKRQKLVQDYASALADRGVGEKADVYRRLTAKCLGMREQEVDGQLDELLRCLEEDGEGGGGS